METPTSSTSTLVLSKENTFATYLFILCQVSVLRTSVDPVKENGFTFKNPGNRQFHVETTTDADYANDHALLENTPVQAESLLHILEQVAGSIGLYVNANKTEYMVFKTKKERSPDLVTNLYD